MKDLTFKAEFRTHGFRVPENLNYAQFEQAKGEFVAMQNSFSEAFNQKIDQINDIWTMYEGIVENGDSVTAERMRVAMDINEDTTYNDWIAGWMEQYANATNSGYGFSSVNLYVFRDGDMPVIGAKFRKHPLWTMDIVLKEA